MHMRAVFLLPVLLVLPMAQSGADKAYTWIDESGTRHYSEDPPLDETLTADQINLLPAPSAGNIGDDNDFYSVINQADRMEKKRLANEKLIAERLQAEIEARRLATEAQAKPQTTSQKDTQQGFIFNPAYPQYMNNSPRPAHDNKPNLRKPVDPERLPAYNPTSSPGD